MDNLKIKKLRKITQGHLKTFWPDRLISIYFTKLFLHLKISANAATLIDLILGVIGLIIMSIGGKFCIFLGSVFMILFIIFDCVDGEIARYNKTVSLRSYYLEGLCHPIMHPLKFMALGLGLSSTLDESIYIYLGILLMFLCTFEQAVTWRREVVLNNKVDEYEYTRSYEGISNILDKIFTRKFSSIIKYFCKEDGMYWAIFFSSCLDLVIKKNYELFDIKLIFSSLIMFGYILVVFLMICINIKKSASLIHDFENNKKSN